ncbi:hypothetical protein HDU97_000922 [Phlyctochytrium planicorne]|nr:hypothetical protein HDU97_000922 [Phlyctochytrium planicorne]
MPGPRGRILPKRSPSGSYTASPAVRVNPFAPWATRPKPNPFDLPPGLAAAASSSTPAQGSQRGPGASRMNKVYLKTLRGKEGSKGAIVQSHFHHYKMGQSLSHHSQHSHTIAEYNKAMVLNATGQLFIHRDISVLNKYWAPNYKQHNPAVPDGRDALAAIVPSLPPTFKYEVGLASAKGDLVWVHGRYTGWAPKPLVAVDIYRVQYGQIAEHWDVMQEEVPANQTKSGRPMFEPPLHLTAFERHKQLADAGNADSQNWLGMIYREGDIGIEKDLFESVKWFKLAADQGHAEGLFNLGKRYELGEGVTMDQAESLRLYIKAAEKGNATAQCSVAYAYQVGQGVPEDRKEAIKWYTASAEQGFAWAQYRIGCLLEDAEEGEKDISEITKWFSKAAAQEGNPPGKSLAQDKTIEPNLARPSSHIEPNLARPSSQSLKLLQTKKKKSTTAQANKAMILSATHKLFNDRDISVLNKYWSPDYKQHNPAVPDGRDALAAIVPSLPPTFKYEIGFASTEGNLVWVHGKYTGWAPKPLVAVDIYKVEDGKIVEHWDVMQEEVPAEQTKSGRPMFEVGI